MELIVLRTVLAHSEHRGVWRHFYIRNGPLHLLTLQIGIEELMWVPTDPDGNTHWGLPCGHWKESTGNLLLCGCPVEMLAKQVLPWRCCRFGSKPPQ